MSLCGQPSLGRTSPGVGGSSSIRRCAALTEGCCSHLHLNDNIGSCVGDDSFDLGLFALGHSELVKSFLEIVEKGFSFYRRDHQMLVGVFIGGPVYF